MAAVKTLGRKILIADDDDAILDAITMVLEDEGYQVEVTADGETARTMKKNHRPDLLLLDIWMSGSDGRDICRYLKTQADTKHIPIILISATKDATRSAKEAGADDFLAKPFDIEELLAKVKMYT